MGYRTITTGFLGRNKKSEGEEDEHNQKALIDELTAKAERLIQDLKKVVATAGDMDDFDSTQM